MNWNFLNLFENMQKAINDKNINVTMRNAWVHTNTNGLFVMCFFCFTDYASTLRKKHCDKRTNTYTETYLCTRRATFGYSL